MTQPIRKIVQITYTDEEVRSAILGEGLDNDSISNWFFTKAKSYALGTWLKKYSRLQEEDWQIIFSDVNFKIVNRIKKGLTLKKGTRLTSYYATVVEYAILDYLATIKKNYTSDINRVVEQEAVLPANNLEKQELANQLRIFLEEVTQNQEQVQVLLLFSKGYSYREIVSKTSYQSEGACRNAFLKAKKKIIAYIQKYPEQGVQLKNLLSRK